MSNLAKRIVTAVILVVALLLALFVLPAPVDQIFFAVFLAVGAWEWAGFWPGNTALQRALFVGVLAGLAFAMGTGALQQPGSFAVLACAVVYWLVALMLMASGVSLSHRWAIALAGGTGLLGAWYALSLLLTAEQGAQKFIWCVAIVAAADIGAYFTGKAFGRRKLAPAISPGKTIEGFLGGVVLAAIAGALGAQYFGVPTVVFGAAGMLIAGISVVGDLWVSRFKRAAGLKDSGHILPGHGGVMDRIDSLIAALPLFALALGLAGGVSA